MNKQFKLLVISDAMMLMWHNYNEVWLIGSKMNQQRDSSSYWNASFTTTSHSCQYKSLRFTIKPPLFKKTAEEYHKSFELFCQWQTSCSLSVIVTVAILFNRKNGKPQKRGKINLIGRLQLSTERSKEEDNEGIVQLRILRVQVRRSDMSRGLVNSLPLVVVIAIKSVTDSDQERFLWNCSQVNAREQLWG